MSDLKHARALPYRFRGDAYRCGFDVLPEAGDLAAPPVRGTFPGSDDHARAIRQALKRAGVAVAAAIDGARPDTDNMPLPLMPDRVADTLGPALQAVPAIKPD